MKPTRRHATVVTCLTFKSGHDIIKVKRLVNLSVSLGEGENIVTMQVEFLVVDQPSTYNAIIGQSLMKKPSMVMIVYCLTVKFPTPTGVGYIKANQVMVVPHLVGVAESGVVGELAETFE